MSDSWEHVKKYKLGKCKSNMYKKELCNTYQETGDCPYGNKCQFAHSQKELRYSDSEKPSSYKTVRCKNFWEKGDCPYGKRCRFVHDEALGFDEGKNKKAMAHPKWRTEPCRSFWNTGRCPYGDRCAYIHIINESGTKQEKSVSQPQEGDQFSALSLKRSPSDETYERNSLFFPFFK
jgi:hypothetical protein